jgi:hypothetical protein
MLPVYSKILPGLSSDPTAITGSEFFVIGPEKQFAAYEEYLKKAEGPNTLPVAVIRARFLDGVRGASPRPGPAPPLLVGDQVFGRTAVSAPWSLRRFAVFPVSLRKADRW